MRVQDKRPFFGLHMDKFGQTLVFTWTNLGRPFWSSLIITMHFSTSCTLKPTIASASCPLNAKRAAGL